MDLKIGIILADTNEYEPVVEHFGDKIKEKTTVGGNEAAVFEFCENKKNIELVAVHCGIGKVNAANACAALIYGCGVDIVLNAGLSGAISGVRREQLVAGSEYVECDFDLRAIGYELGVKPDGDEYIHEADSELLEIVKNLDGFDIKVGRLGTGDIFLTDKVRKDEYKSLFSLTAFDMETAAIACVCSKNDTAFLSIRKISDDADDASVDDYREMNDRREDILAKVLLAVIMQIINKD